jgi:phage baseplate assembly protein gpV
MALAVITVNNPSPALDTRAQEVQVVQRAVEIADSQIRIAGGTQASGTMLGSGGVVLGTWTYTAVASA